MTKSIITIILFTALALTAKAQAPTPTELNPENFDSTISQNPETIKFVMFGAKWCMHCNEFLHEDYPSLIGEAADQVSSPVKFYLTYHKEGNNNLFDRFGMYSFPRFIAIRGGKYWRFDDTRSRENLIKFLNNLEDSKGSRMPGPWRFYSHLTKFIRFLPIIIKHEWKKDKQKLMWNIGLLVILFVSVVMGTMWILEKIFGPPPKRRRRPKKKVAESESEPEANKGGKEKEE
jgi:hypothetical protein